MISVKTDIFWYFSRRQKYPLNHKDLVFLQDQLNNLIEMKFVAPRCALVV